MNIKSRIRQWRTRQRGIVLVLVVVAMTSVLGMAGLAMDFGLAFLTKTRIQNALDAAALAGAKVLKSTGNTTQASTDAQTAFNYYLGELNRGSLTPAVEFSATVNPFQTGTTPSNFIRVRMPDGYTIPTYLTRVFPGVGDVLTLGGSAVAGPIRLEPPNELCNLVPIMVAVAQPIGAAIDTDCDDDGSCYGYRIGQQLPLTLTASAGPGNFNFLRMGDVNLTNNANGAGGQILRNNLAGAYNGCRLLGGGESSQGNINTQPGRAAGPFKQGINTRFGEHGQAGLSPSEYPPDINTSTFASYSAYKNAIASGNLTNPPPSGVPGRRLIRIVFSDVRNGGFTGTSTPVPISGFGCFFLLSPAEGQGNGPQPLHIQAEFTNDCSVPNGGLSNLPLDNQGAFFKIVLYKDSGSGES